MSLRKLFSAKHIAVIGASRTTGKLGNVILSNLLHQDYDAYPVNPYAEKILGRDCYKSITNIPIQIDLAIVVVPANYVLDVIDDCYKAKISSLIIISSGFKETGNPQLEQQLANKIREYGLTCVGPNCLGIYDAYTKLDTLFLPDTVLKRPNPGGISFVAQSGALASAILDLLAKYGFAKFISYGNAAAIDETDILEFLSEDPQTKVILLYLEGVKFGRKFIEKAKRIKKPIICLKGGQTQTGAHATLTHTGSLAGDARIYHGIFEQTKILEVQNLSELTSAAKLFANLKHYCGRKVMIITNGGGYGIITADQLEKNGLVSAEINSRSLRKLPQTITRKNPLDLLGDATAEHYKHAIEAAIGENVDAIICIVLPQTPTLDHDELVRELKKYHEIKPILAVTTGAESANTLKRKIEDVGITCYEFPEDAVKALALYVKYWNR